MKILLINAPIWKYTRFRSSYNPGLGLPYLGAILKSKGHEVRIIDAEALQWWHDDVYAFITEWQPTHVGISCLTNGMKSACDMAKMIKRFFPKIFVAMGGVGPSAMPGYALKKSGADSVTQGEAELVIEESFTKYGIVIGKSPDDLDSLPQPDFGLIEPPIGSSKWSGNYPKPPINGEIRETTVMWSRGCPHACTFCSKATMPRKYPRLRSPENIVAELKTLKDKFNINSVFVYDDELIGMGDKHNEWIISVCKAIKEANLGIAFKGQGRCSVKFINEEVIKALKDAGFFAMMMGCESGSEKVKRAIRKGTTNADIVHTLRMLHNGGINVFGFWMVGLPEETRQDVHETEKLIIEMAPYMDWCQVSIFSPLPGSDFWDEAYDKHWFRFVKEHPTSQQHPYEDFLDDFMEYAHSNFQTETLLEMPWMSPDEVMKQYNKLLMAFDAAKAGRI